MSAQLSSFLGYSCEGSFPGGSAVKNLPAIQETQEMWVQSLGWEDPLEEEKVIFLLGKSIAEEPGGLQSMELQKSQTQLTRTYRVESFDHLQHPRESSASGIKERDLATKGSVSSRSL